VGTQGDRVRFYFFIDFSIPLHLIKQETIETRTPSNTSTSELSVWILFSYISSKLIDNFSQEMVTVYTVPTILWLNK